MGAIPPNVKMYEVRPMWATITTSHLVLSELILSSNLSENMAIDVKVRFLYCYKTLVV